MSGLVGDVIMEVRRRIPDIPPILSPPTFSLADPFAGSMPPGTYYVIATVLTPWGETSPAAEQSFNIVPINKALTVTVNYPFGATAARVYIGTAAGGETIYYQTIAPLPVTPGNIAISIANFGTANAGLTGPTLGIPPTRSTAFLPDNDGRFIGAYSMYDLLNEALRELVRRADGIVDFTGVQAQNGQALYRIVAPQAGARFFNFTNIWFDGYPMDIVPRAQIYLRQAVPGFTGIVSFESEGDDSIMQCWPQCNRTGGQTTLSAPMAVTDISATVVSTTSFLSLGLLLIDAEIMAYTQPGTTTFPNIIRGLAGTRAATHASGATVTELNLRLSGKRMSQEYNPGDALQPLRVPPAWETALVKHMLAQVRSMEQQDDLAERLDAEFATIVKDITKASLRSTKPRQVQIGGATGLETYNVNGVGFGWLVP